MKNTIIEVVCRFCPKMLMNLGIKFLRFFRNFFSVQAISSVRIIDLSREDRHVFFGYYDVTPFSNDDKLLLAMQAPIINRSPGINDEAEVGFYCIDDLDLNFISLGKTNTWCWQQGCRLQWYGEGSKHIIYNCLVDGQYGSVIKEIYSGKTVKEIKKPLYSISKNGKWGLSLDFSRLQRLRPGYGYSALKDESQGELIPKQGIDLVNMERGEWRQLFSLPDIAKIEPHKSMDGAEHYFNHLMFNPSGDKFLFYHLWNKDGEKYSRIFVANIDGSNIELLNNSGRSSHYNWISDNEIILYSYIEERSKYAYAIFNLDEKIKYFSKNVPKQDGHPTFLRNREIFITDTYPDLLSQRSILSYNIKKDKTKVMARFDNPNRFTGEFRCDLHPRISNNGKMICVDRFISQKRSISILSIN